MQCRKRKEEEKVHKSDLEYDNIDIFIYKLNKDQICSHLANFLNNYLLLISNLFFRNILENLKLQYLDLILIV